MKKIITSLFLIAATAYGIAQETVTYQKPTAEILALADYTRPPVVQMNNHKTSMVYLFRPTYKSLADLNKQDMKLAGLRIDPAVNMPSTLTYYDNVMVKGMQGKEKQVTGLPTNPQMTHFGFSPDDRYLAFTHTTETGAELWVIDMTTGQAKKLTGANLNGNMGRPYTWLNDSQTLLVNRLPEQKGTLINEELALPKGPTVEVSSGKVSQNRTYQDMLKSPADEHNFEILATSGLYKVGVDGSARKFKGEDLYIGKSLSPDGKYVMLTTLLRPFSYIVPYSRFPQKTVVYDLNGTEIKTVNEVALNEIQPKGFSSTRTGKRSMGWRSDEPATLSFVEALDGGDQNQTAEYRDEVFTWKAPFDAAPVSLFKLKNRYSGVQWADENNAFISERWFDTRNIKTHWFNPKTGKSKLIEDRNYQDAYNDPGSFYRDLNEFGRSVVKVNAGKVYLLGDGFTKQGQFPFLNELDLKTFKIKRLYTAAPKTGKEDLIDILDLKKGELLTQEESPVDYPNYFVKNIKNGKKTQLTGFENPFVGLKDVYKEVIRYKRADGVDLFGTLYLPAGYDRNSKSEKLPLLVWAYPTEYKDRATAGMVTKNENTFTYPSYGSFIYWVTKGYAVLDGASFPIIGEGNEEPNDTFIEQLVANGKAAIDAVDALGYIDRNKVAVGGHSYGAFMTANLLTHSDDFACGIARSGAYNRTLTPFGFQYEQRNYWDDPNLYNTMSPFMHADEMKKPLLLIHGEADNNAGTFTMQSIRYFQALKNLGAEVRLVLLPKESHGYAAKENVLHLLYEQDTFLEKCLKDK